MAPLPALLFAGLLLAAGSTSGQDDPGAAPPVPSTTPPTQAPATSTADPEGGSNLRASGQWRMVPSAPEQKSGVQTLELAPSIEITWPALDPGEIEAARTESTSRATVTGVHREMPPGFQGNLLEDLSWSVVGQRRQGLIELGADGAESIRVQFRASLPPDSSLTFHGTHNESTGSPPPVWTQSILAARQADSTAIWSPSGQEGALEILVDVPASTSLAGHFLTFEKISHRWPSTSSVPLQRRLTPADGGYLECPLYYVHAACYSSRFPSDAQYGDMRGMVVHIHYESGFRSYVCSGTMITQRGVPTPRTQKVTSGLSVRLCNGVTVL